jgi:N12 class adenine-specific DNA methylase
MTNSEYKSHLNNYFTKSQAAIIDSNTILTDNIKDFISVYRLGTLGNKPTLELLYLAQLRDSLNYLSSLKTTKDASLELTAYNSFAQFDIFNKPTGEIFLFTVLLFTPGALKTSFNDLFTEIYHVNEPLKITDDYIAFLQNTLISTINLNKKNNAYTNKQFNIEDIQFNNFEFNTQRSLEAERNQYANSSKFGAISTGENRPTEIGLNSTKVEQLPNTRTRKESSSIGESAKGNLGSTQSLLTNKAHIDISNAVFNKAHELLDLINLDLKERDKFGSLKFSDIVFPDSLASLPNPIYLLQITSNNRKSVVYNLLDYNGNIISTPNWRNLSIIGTDVRDYANETETLFRNEQSIKLFELATNSTNTQAFLTNLHIAKLDKQTIQNHFGIHSADDRQAKLNKFEKWFKIFKEQNNDGITILQEHDRESLGEQRNEAVQTTQERQGTRKLRNRKSNNLYTGNDESPRDGGSRTVGDGKIILPSDALNKTFTNPEALNPFYITEFDNTFNVLEKYKTNSAALKILLDCLQNDRGVHEDERLLLSKYVGFGGLKDIFLDPTIETNWDESNNKYRETILEIKQSIQSFEDFGYSNLLSSIQSSTFNAHFTNDVLIKAIYSGIEKMGFKGGNILEPSAGTGNFIGLMPEFIRENSKITQVEIEPITALINKLIYTDTTVINSGLQNANINNHFDLIISNIPFGDTRVFDKDFTKEKKPLLNKIHAYFFAKAIDLANEGGIIAFVTSKGVLDSPANKNIREYIDNNANFIGAYRLPNGTFKNANTSVTTDLIFLQKKYTGQEQVFSNSCLTTNIIEAETKDGTLCTYNFNEYFVNHPENVIGELQLGGMYSQNDYHLKGNLSLLDNLKENIYNDLPQLSFPVKSITDENATINEQNILTEFFKDIKVGSLGMHQNILYKKLFYDVFETVKLPEKDIPKIKAYLDVKGLLNQLIALEYADENVLYIERKRGELQQAHKQFIDKYKSYADALKNIQKIDNDCYNVFALIKADGSEANILSKRSIAPIKQSLQTNNIDDAIIYCLYNYNAIHIDTIANLMNISSEKVLDLSENKLFYDIDTNRYVEKDSYLSGNVKAKLKNINAAIEGGNQNLLLNKQALESVIPKDIPAVQISVLLGSRWVDDSYYNQFIEHLLDTKNINIAYSKGTDTYYIEGFNANAKTEKKYGTNRIRTVDLISHALHFTQPIIRDLVSRDPDKYEINKVDTAYAKEKLTLIKDEFENWIWKSPNRREVLGRCYNDIYNTTITKSFNGEHLSFEGMANISLLAHQKNAVWRTLQRNGGIMDHIVGSGKTFIMVAIAMKLKQMNIANKPMIIALKSTIPQIVESFRYAYPNANILAPTEKDFSKENRKQVFSQIALNDWDCVILTHDQFGMIPHLTTIETDAINQELDEIDAEISAVNTSPLSIKETKKIIKSLTTKKNNLLARVKDLANLKKDDTLTFQEMGIDHLMVDESQQFKNLTYTSKINNVAGMGNQKGSKRAFNLLMACRSIQAKYNNDEGITFLSGTPISNSLVELFLIFKYLRKDKLAEINADTFDKWASIFANPQSNLEYTVSGSFKQVTRFSEFINVPELVMLYTEIADIQDDNNLKLDKPSMKTNGYIIKKVEMNEEQMEYNQRLIRFIETKDGNHIGMGKLSDEQKLAYMLIATNLSNKLSIDMRMIDPSYEYNPSGKIGMLCEEVYNIYQISNEDKGTQLIFSDIGTPKTSHNINDLLLQYLQDTLSIDEESLKKIYGNLDVEKYVFDTREKIDAKILDVLSIDQNELDNLYLQASNSLNDFNLYAETKFRLIEKGIPENEIVFIHDYKTNKAKMALFDKVNKGEIRVVLGSTQKLGTGTNVQKKLVSIHHLDIPWRPSDMEQRNGRGLRQGNELAKAKFNNEVSIFTYCTELTLDTYKYQLLHSKDFLIKQIKNNAIDPNNRIIRQMDEAEGGMGFAHLMAELSGNKDVLIKIKLEQEIETLKRSKKGFEANRYEAERLIEHYKESIPQKQSQLIEYINDQELFSKIPDVEDRPNSKNWTTINDTTFENRKDLGKALMDLVDKSLDNVPTKVLTKVCLLNGHQVYAKNVKSIMGNYTEMAIDGTNNNKHFFNYNKFGGITLNNIDYVIASLSFKIETLQKDIIHTKEKLDANIEVLKEVWPNAEKLENTIKLLNEVNLRFASIEKKNDISEDNIDHKGPTMDDDDYHLVNNPPKPKNAETLEIITHLNKIFPNVELIIRPINHAYNEPVTLGLVKNNAIYLNENYLNINTAIHEYGHLWLRVLKIEYPQAHLNIINKIVAHPECMDIIRNNPNYKHISSAEKIAEEFLAQAIGEKGNKLFYQIKDKSFVAVISRFIENLWLNIKSLFNKNINLRDNNVANFKNLTIKNIISGVSNELVAKKEVITLKSSSELTIIQLQKKHTKQHTNFKYNGG